MSSRTDWELICDENEGRVIVSVLHRISVPGGWLYRHTQTDALGSKQASLVFVPLATSGREADVIPLHEIGHEEQQALAS